MSGYELPEPCALAERHPWLGEDLEAHPGQQRGQLAGDLRGMDRVALLPQHQHVRGHGRQCGPLWNGYVGSDRLTQRRQARTGPHVGRTGCDVAVQAREVRGELGPDGVLQAGVADLSSYRGVDGSGEEEHDLGEAVRRLGQQAQQRVRAERDAEGLGGLVLVGDSAQVVGEVLVAGRRGTVGVAERDGEDLGAGDAGQQGAGLGDAAAVAVGGDRDGQAAAGDDDLLGGYQEVPVPVMAGLTSTR
jgi:hypothetical protein